MAQILSPMLDIRYIKLLSKKFITMHANVDNFSYRCTVFYNTGRQMDNGEFLYTTIDCLPSDCLPSAKRCLNPELILEKKKTKGCFWIPFLIHLKGIQGVLTTRPENCVFTYTSQ